MAGDASSIGRRLARAAHRLAGCTRLFSKARSGSIAIEYSVIAGLVSTAIVASLGMIVEPLGQLLAGIGRWLATG